MRPRNIFTPLVRAIAPVRLIAALTVMLVLLVAGCGDDPIAPVPATKLGFGYQPSNTAAGAAISPSVTVLMLNASGSTVTDASGTITIAIGANPGTSTLSGTATAAVVFGVATFPTLSLDKVGVGYTLAAAATGLTGTISTAFTVTAGAATQLAFTVQPSSAVAGAAIGPAVAVTVRDASGNTVTSASGNITIAIGANPGASTLAGTATAAVVNGVATFSTLSLNRVGTGYTLTAAATGLPTATSTAFNVTVGTAAQLAFTVLPSNTPAGVAISPNVAVSVRDASGNTVTSATNSITVAIGNNPGASTLSGTATVAAVSGVATFSALSLNRVGTGYTLTAAATGLTGATSPAFNVTDVVAPTVLTTVPADAATGVSRSPAITATFSEAMAPATLNATTFTLRMGATPVAGTVTYAGTTATLIPTTTLAPNTTFTATISTGATDVAGNALAAVRIWNFTTVATSATGPAAVNLGSAGSYVILAKSGVSTTGATSVVGDIGLSPSAASFITGFGLILDAGNTFATSSLVTGRVWASDYAPPTPSNLTTAVADMETAYTDAAGRVLPDFTELGAGNIDGMTLVPGLYKWGTGVSIPIVVTLTGGANDVFIFQIGQNLTVGNGAMVTLSGCVQARNVFWQVAGQTTLGTTANFKGIVLGQTLIAFNTGAIMTGRAFAQTAVTLNATAITNP